jgi:glycosyltransferase involved in cell wall biosynthesis
MSLFTPSSVAVIIPVFNEVRQIQHTIAPLLAAGYTVIAVDDHSTDGTEQVLKSLPVHMIRHVINLGQGAALQTGMVYAQRLKVDYLVHFDADGQHRCEDIPGMLEPLIRGEADVVLGSRFLRAEDRAAIPVLRKLLLRLAIRVNYLLTGVKLSDAHNGFRAFTQAAAKGIDLKENRMAHATEILWQLRDNKLRIAEHPVHISYTDYSRQKGQSSLNAFHIFMDLILRKLL